MMFVVNYDKANVSSYASSSVRLYLGAADLSYMLISKC